MTRKTLQNKITQQKQNSDFRGSTFRLAQAVITWSQSKDEVFHYLASVNSRLAHKCKYDYLDKLPQLMGFTPCGIVKSTISYL